MCVDLVVGGVVGVLHMFWVVEIWLLGVCWLPVGVVP